MKRMRISLAHREGISPHLHQDRDTRGVVERAPFCAGVHGQERDGGRSGEHEGQ